jgi:hypothetical protein
MLYGGLSLMIKKSLFLALIASALVSYQVSAATISFLVLETGLPMEAAANEHSGLWESGLLDVFFEGGHIVSNAPVLRIDGKPSKSLPEEAEEAFDEAVAGGAEYFIVAVLDYSKPGDGIAEKPNNVSMRIFKANSEKSIYEGKYTDKVSKNLKDEFENVKKAARGILPRINGK